MSRHVRSIQVGCRPSLGAWFRQLRQARKLPIRSVAAAVEIDSTLLSKIELGQRFPTEAQTTALARFFAIPAEDMEARRIAEKFWKEHEENPVVRKAALMIRVKADQP